MRPLLKICGLMREEDVALCCRKGLEYIGEVRTVHYLKSMLWVDIKATCTAYNKKSGICTGQNVTKMLQGSRMLWENLRRPCSECVNNNIVAAEILRSKVEQILDNSLFSSGSVISLYKSRNIKTSSQCFLYDELTCFSVCTYNCDFHNDYLRIITYYFYSVKL